MANRYNSFECFMIDVIDEANKVHKLNELFEINNISTLEMTKKIITKGWWIFFTLSLLFSLGAPALGGAIATFLTSPVGWFVMLALGFTAAVKIRQLYKDKELPLAIKNIGEKYKEKYSKLLENKCSNLEIDNLLKNAIEDLLLSAKKSLSDIEKQVIKESVKKIGTYPNSWD